MHIYPFLILLKFKHSHLYLGLKNLGYFIEILRVVDLILAIESRLGKKLGISLIGEISIKN